MSSWYERRILPHLINGCCGSKPVSRLRAEVVPLASGRVLELGIGSGRNLRFYDPDRVSSVVGIDPSPELRAIALGAERPAGLAIEFVDGEAETLPFGSGSFDTVVCTFTLCSVRDPAAVLEEARRVLAPGGRFLFCEHGQAPDPGVVRWQRRIDPLWGRAFGGCHVSRPVEAAIARSFRIERHESRYLAWAPRPIGWHEWGSAIA
jgi:ubiquinone/menaquinone biosynthesis C-methylase UbiE